MRAKLVDGAVIVVFSAVTMFFLRWAIDLFEALWRM